MNLLFWRDQEAAVAVEEPPAPVEPQPEKPWKIEAETEWLSLGKELGLTHGRIKELELRAFLREEGIPTYGHKAVHDYLVAKNGGEPFNFYALRDADFAIIKSISLWATGDFWDKKKIKVNYDRCYRSLPPYPVLLTMKKLVDKFGEDVHFCVAAISDDPFLFCFLGDSHITCIERWDEPSFRS